MFKADLDQMGAVKTLNIVEKNNPTAGRAPSRFGLEFWSPYDQRRARPFRERKATRELPFPAV
jgi:hypothetical protein